MFAAPASAAPFQLAAPAWLHALWLAPLVLLLAAWAIARTAHLLRRFAAEPMLARLAGPPNQSRHWLKAWLLAGALALLAGALARPRTNPQQVELPIRGRDIVFVVDVSRSMLARDLAPNRLARAKLWINDLASNLQGDRVALVAFAGAATVRCPLTLDRAFFKLALEELDPSSAPLGGTAIGDAIRKATTDVFHIHPETNPADNSPTRDIILITDGEDQDSFPLEAAAAAGEANIRIIAIGIGSQHDGARVPDDESTSGYATYQGQAVRSRLDADTLATIAAATPAGVFLNVGTGTIDLAQIDRDLLDSAARDQTGRRVTYRYTERFWLLLAAAFMLLLAESLIPTRTKAQA